MDYANSARRLHLANYVKIFSDDRASEVFLNSLSMSAVAAGAALRVEFLSCRTDRAKGRPHVEASALVVDTRSVGVAGNCGRSFDC